MAEMTQKFDKYNQCITDAILVKEILRRPLIVANNI